MSSYDPPPSTRHLFSTVPLGSSSFMVPLLSCLSTILDTIPPRMRQVSHRRPLTGILTRLSLLFKHCRHLSVTQVLLSSYTKPSRGCYLLSTTTAAFSQHAALAPHEVSNAPLSLHNHAPGIKMSLAVIPGCGERRGEMSCLTDETLDEMATDEMMT